MPRHRAAVASVIPWWWVLAALAFGAVVVWVLDLAHALRVADRRVDRILGEELRRPRVNDGPAADAAERGESCS